jgi:hypothetical protein
MFQEKFVQIILDNLNKVKQISNLVIFFKTTFILIGIECLLSPVASGGNMIKSIFKR